MSVTLFLQVLALVFLAIATFKTPEPGHFAFGWAGLTLWMLTVVFGGLKF